MCGPRLEPPGAGGSRLVALLLGITAVELQSKPGIPILLKKRDLLQLTEVEVYFDQLSARMRQGQR